jgi:hypothetical protein
LASQGNNAVRKIMAGGDDFSMEEWVLDKLEVGCARFHEHLDRVDEVVGTKGKGEEKTRAGQSENRSTSGGGSESGKAEQGASQLAAQVTELLDGPDTSGVRNELLLQLGQSCQAELKAHCKDKRVMSRDIVTELCNADPDIWLAESFLPMLHFLVGLVCDPQKVSLEDGQLKNTADADAKDCNQLPNTKMRLLYAMDIVAKAAHPQFNQRMQVLMGIMTDQLSHSKNMFILGSALGACTSCDTIRNAIDQRAMAILKTMFKGDYADKWMALAAVDADLEKLAECYANVVEGGIVPFAGPCIIGVAGDNTQRQASHARIKKDDKFSVLVQTNSKFVAIPEFKFKGTRITSDVVLSMVITPAKLVTEVQLSDVMPKKEEVDEYFKDTFVADLANCLEEELGNVRAAVSKLESQRTGGAAAGGAAAGAGAALTPAELFAEEQAELWVARHRPAARAAAPCCGPRQRL